MRFWGFFVFGIFYIHGLNAQGLQPIGGWREHLPWGEALRVQLLDKELICATPYAVFKYNIQDREYTRKSKVNGLSDIGVTAMAVDDLSGSVIIAYKSKMIDIWRKDAIIPVPDLKITQVAGDFTVNAISVLDGVAYLSTNAGILLLDIQKHEIKERWLPGYNDQEWSTTSICKVNDHWYASTKLGMKKINSSKEGSDPGNWQLVSSTLWSSNAPIQKVVSSGSNLIAWTGNQIFKGLNDDFQILYETNQKISALDATDQGILVSATGTTPGINFINMDGVINKTYHANDLLDPQNAIIIESECWVADKKNGLIKISENSSEKFTPNGPTGFAKGDIKYINGAMYFATASVRDAWIQGFNKSGIFKYTDEWNVYDFSTFKAFDSIPDFVTIAYQPQKRKLYGASFGGGLLEIDPQNNIKVYKYNSGLGAYPSSSGNFNVSGLAVDPLSNLWIANFGSEKQLHLLKPDGKWYSFSIPFNILYNAVAGITIDDDNLKWIISPKGNGLLVWNTGNLPEDPADDEWRLLTKGTGSGNLPSNNVLCAVKDRNGLIWVGTDKGIGIINCRTSALSNICDAILPVVNSANQTGYLFQDQKVNVIAIDGANRKWIGTSNGLWLISDDGEKVIQYFNIENSSLLSNEIYSLALNPITGELFIATSNGICSYRANATENVEEERKVLVFPNPVPPAYSGVIAIRGLPENSWVKITEINGRLVYQGKSLGGQMVWNGKDGNGRSVSSGVYLVLSKDDMNQDKVVTKIFLTR